MSLFFILAGCFACFLAGGIFIGGIAYHVGRQDERLTIRFPQHPRL